MKTRRIAAALLLSILPSTVSIPAWSQTQGDDPVTLQARARFKEGVDAFDKGKYEEARLAFLQAYTLKRHPAVLLNLAQSSMRSNHTLDAARYFQRFLKEATTANAQQRQDAEAALAEVRQKLGRIAVVAPEGTEIALDDEGKVGVTPMDPIDVEPGQHTVRSPTHSASVIAVVGQTVEAKLGQSVIRVAAAQRRPTVVPPAPAEPATEVDGTMYTKKVDLFSRPATMAPVYVGLTVAGAGLVSAILFAVFKAEAQSKADEVADNIRTAARARTISTTGVCNNPNAPEFNDACNVLRENNSTVNTNATIANVSLAVMGAGLALAGGWYLFAPKRDDDVKPETGRVRSPKAPLVTPYAGWNSGGVSVAGEF
ncbi:MAG TPA: hypothetical protein VM580_15340 [Labilithrix sp.]|jgi:hypothetical protein|nr:hypothetical protein [Labilithrix sp.]